jgi:outer membrane receptor protein involved in Fe transport
VQTDIDGNVSLRGSGNFLVLIDGRPSPLEGSEALQQIPSSSIESIEIITNPSAKFDPDGVGGIINVILKKERREGINGQFSVSYGSYNSLSADALVNIRTNKINWFVGLDINKRTNIGEGLFEQRTYGADTLVVNKQSIGERGRNGGKIRAGFDYYISDNDILTFSGQYGKNGFGRISIDTAQSYYISNNTHTNEYFYLSDNVFDISGNFWAGDINYVHKFMKKGHEIQAYAYYSSDFDSELNKYVETGFDNQLYNQIINSDSTRTTEKSNVDDIRMKLDYTLPLFTEGKLEAGYQVKQRFSDNQYLYQLGGPNDQWIDSSELSNNYTFDRNIQSGYLTFSNITGKFGYMLGLRTEYTYRVLHQSQITQDFDSVYNKFNFFPTLHISYKMPWDLQVLASYSRRIQRPRGHFLDPFPEVVDPYNIKQGNPMLEPEFTNAAELNLQKTFGSNYISFEAYFRETSNKIERIKTVSETNSEIIISTFENIGEDMSAGGELMTNISFTKWWNFNLSGDVYYYKITGNDLSNVSTNSTINWGVRTNQTFRIKKTNSSIQLSGFYHGPNITSQGTTKGMGMVNIAFRQDFLDRRLSLTLNLRDIFGTMNHEFIYNTPTFYSYNLFDRKSPTFNFTITYRLNDYKRRKDNIDGPELESGDDAGM